MAIYSVLEHPSGDPMKTSFIREGFSFAAFFFTVIWALWQRMWIVAALLFAVFVALQLLQRWFGVDSGIVAAMQIAVALLFGWEARRLKLLSLERAGYRHAGLVAGSRRAAAELDYFGQPGILERDSDSRRTRVVAGDALGLFDSP